MRNLFDDLPHDLPEELTDVLAEGERVRIERIVSTGQASPENFWYDQPQAEWVVLLAGSATLRLEGEPQPLTLQPGDHLLLPAGRRHRVERTSPDEPTVWLCVFFDESARTTE
ncbi:cupin domain-containing protein [Stratiformator vulcanicus]|uniref:Cupin domain protein n=1 Tax=Stratiformator vulcanicus TaxID=2527980 RepID=A0A517QYJ2_9PLAN|nr:cupin domain-containing protein [Stratiformator vulcanicus]QDT36727.1 Cupin domain protein [Stratiformator vulcanicus]